MPMSSTSAFAASNSWAESQLGFLKALDVRSVVINWRGNKFGPNLGGGIETSFT